MTSHQANSSESNKSAKSNADYWIERDLSVYMHRESLDDIPNAPLPPGYTIRTYSAGDESEWLAIHLAADLKNTFNDGTFRRQFGNNASLLSTRQFYVCAPDHSIIGTTTAWFKGSPGLIHWVAITPEYQGRGLSKPLLSAACKRLRDLGHAEACLHSSTSRLPALCLYTSFGFRPGHPPKKPGGNRIHRSEEEEKAWNALEPKIKARLSLR